MAVGRPNTGFTLIEVMVAMLVLSVGLLGMAGMLAQSMRFNQDAYVRTQATFLAYDMMDRMRASSETLDNFEGGDPAVACSVVTATATNDRACWYDMVQSTLPGGGAAIDENPDGSGQFDITLSWVDRNTGEPSAQSWTVRF